MKVKDVIEKWLQYPAERCGWFDIEDLCTALDLQSYDYDFYEGDNSSLIESVLYEKRHLSWICTDTMVGFTSLWFNNELAGISIQTGRKCSKDHYFVSEEICKKIIEFLNQFKHQPNFWIIPSEKDIPEDIEVHTGFDTEKMEPIIEIQKTETFLFGSSHYDAVGCFQDILNRSQE